MPHHIVIVEDDPVTQARLEDYFVQEGYRVSVTASGAGLHELMLLEPVDLILLDINLPGENGLMLTRALRERSTVGIILVTGRCDQIDRIVGLEMGADDYVTKPFSNRELQARVKALLRRSEFAADPQLENEADTEIVIGDLHILPDAFLVQKGNKELDLTHREFELLYHLATHVGQVMTREHLLETVWGYDYFGDVRTVDVTVRRLREKIEDTPGRPEYILTRRGVGYYMRNND